MVLEPAFLDRVARTGLVLKQKLAALKDRYPAVIAEIRGEGLIMGLRTHVPNTAFVQAARDHHLLTIGAGDNVVRLVPPLVIGEDEIADAVARMEAACADLQAEADARQGAA